MSAPWLDALELILDNAVDRWHEANPNEERSLHDWLGVSWDAYAEYVMHGVDGLVERLAEERAALATEVASSHDRSEPS